MAFTKVILTGTKDKIKAAFQRFNTLIDDLLATTSGKGASQIGIQDTALNMDALNVEDALAEIYTDTASVRTLGETFAVDSATTTGLTWGYTAGTVRFDNTITTVAAGTVSLTDNATNYVEVASDGTVSRNTTGFTSGRIPIRQIITASGAQTTSTDKRSWFQSWDVPLPVAKGGTGAITLTDGGILLGSGTGAITALGVATNGQIPIGDGTTDPVLAAISGTANQITVTNGTGTITLSLPADVIIPTITTIPNTGLHILDTNASHDLIIKPGSDLTADRTLTLTTGDADRTISLAGNLTTAGAVSISTYGASLVDDATAGDALTTLGVSTYAKTLLDDAAAATAVATLGITATASEINNSIDGCLATYAEINTACDGATAKNSHTHAQATIENAAIGQAQLKTSQGSVSGAWDAVVYHNLTLPGGEYGFYPQIKHGAAVTYNKFAYFGWIFTSTSYYTGIAFTSSDLELGAVTYAQQRYVTASGEVFWIFMLRDKVTKKIVAMYQSPDHPCFGNGGKPSLIQHPFRDYDETKHEIIVINPSLKDVEKMEAECERGKDESDLDLLELILNQYEIDENSEPQWPTIPVTVGLPKDYGNKPMGEKIVPIKKVIPRPANVLCKSLRAINN